MVNKEAIKSAIVDKEEELKSKMRTEKIVERELKVEKITEDVASIITGVRRCGKSMLAFMLTQQKNATYVNFEDERLQLREEELNAILEAIASLKGNVEFIVFDEIQYVYGWERFISRILPTKKVIITGSNARLMSKEFATFLTGRHIDFNLFPFSFRGYLLLNGFNPNIYLTEDIAKRKNLLVEYLKMGGFPLAYKVGRRFISENYSDIVERDVIQRYNIKFKNAVKELAKYYVSNCAQEVSFNRLKNILNLKSVHTVKDYSIYLSNAYLIFFLERFSPKLKESIIAPKKIYCIDNGIVNTIGFKISENIGSLMENLVAVELFRRKSYWAKEWEIYYWKDSQQHEVDFVIKNGMRVTLLIQVTSASGKDEVERREISSLIKASEQLNCKELLTITWDYEDELKIENKTIKFLPLWKWLITPHLF
ncbi:MAG: ATP-binding protein [Candidatus Micrarchaeaceae archaeon]